LHILEILKQLTEYPEKLKGIVVAGLCRTRDQDIERAAEALKPAEQKEYIHSLPHLIFT